MNKYDKAINYIYENYALSCEECKQLTGSYRTCEEWMQALCTEEHEMYKTCLEALSLASKNLDPH